MPEVGSSLTLDLDEHGTIYAKISKAFVPFTKSAVMLVDLIDPPPSLLPADSGNRAVLKVFDPRVLDDRLASKHPRPWSVEAERAAAERRIQSSTHKW